MNLPPPVRDLAARLGAVPDGTLAAVALVQRGSMRDRPHGREMRFRAEQTIRLDQPGFEWRARTGPLGWVCVTDALRESEPVLSVRAFGIRLASASGPAAAKGELMRYLAELAWAPDAILRNPALAWTVVDATTLLVRAALRHAQGEVALHLDEAGRIARISAPDRPRLEARAAVERPWRGRFFDYRWHKERWLPFAAEVGWVLDGTEWTAWRGQLTSWSVT